MVQAEMSALVMLVTLEATQAAGTGQVAAAAEEAAAAMEERVTTGEPSAAEVEATIEVMTAKVAVLAEAAMAKVDLTEVPTLA